MFRPRFDRGLQGFAGAGCKERIPQPGRICRHAQHKRQAHAGAG
nr:MAG TPA: hypothetical protein [Caudoviricetes sp.]